MRWTKKDRASLIMRARIARRLNELGWSMVAVADAFRVTATTIAHWFTVIKHRSVLPRGGSRLSHCGPRGPYSKAVLVLYPTVKEKDAMHGVVYEDVKLPPSTNRIIRFVRPLISSGSSCGTAAAMCVEA